MPPPSDIDAVYTWVDASRPDYLALMRRHATTPRDLNPERFRDSYDLLRHSLRSLERYAPWVRRVYLFTCRPQVPAWLRTDHPRLRIVHHDEVGADPAALPTFNSNVIETLLHRLPGISAHFLYFNDDYFLGAPASPADFYAADGRIKVIGTLVGERFRARVHEHRTISIGALEHAPLLIDRAAWAAMQAFAAAELGAPHRHRFRSPADVRPDRLYSWYLLTHARDRAVAEPFWRFLRHARFHKITNHLARQQRAVARLRRDRPRFFCLNDDQRDHPHPEVVALVRRLLADFYPEPSSFERADGHPPPAAGG